MKLDVPIDIKLTSRFYEFSRQHAVRDVYDALVELITNCDDSYHRLYENKQRTEDGGPILVKICKQKKGKPSLVRVCDRAEGMTLVTMRDKLGEVGNRYSKKGDRGFMGRGAKDCTELGDMIVESIKDEKYYKCELTSKSKFVAREDGRSVDKEIRGQLGIERGNGTVVSLEIDSRHTIPLVDTIIRELPWHYALRDILSEYSPTKLLIRNLNNPGKLEKVVYRQPKGELIAKEDFIVPGYREATARLIIWKMSEPLEDTTSYRFRRLGLIIKGKRAIHECSFLHPGLEKDPHVSKYFGRLECDFIDKLTDEYDARRENDKQHPPENPSLLIDPHRREGLKRDHPFTEAFFKIPTDKLRELIEKDKEQNKTTQKEIASKETQKRLDELAKAASKFLTQQVEELKEITGDDKRIDRGLFSQKGVLIYPNYINISVGEIRSLAFYVNRSLFNKEDWGVTITSTDPAVSVLDVPFKLKPHEKRDNVLSGTFRIRGEVVKDGISLQSKSEGIPQAEAIVSVLENKIEEHDFINPLEFEHKQYSVREGSSKTLRLYAKYPELVTQGTVVTIVSSDSESVLIKGRCHVIPVKGSNYALGEVIIKGRRLKGKSKISASLNDNTATTDVRVTQKEERGVSIDIQIRDEDFGNYRAIWADDEGRPNLLLVSARHDSLKRYLKYIPEEGRYEGSDTPIFRIILAEIVAESVCRKALGHEAEERPGDFRFADCKDDHIIVNTVLAHLHRRIRDFVAIAHKIMLSDTEIK